MSLSGQVYCISGSMPSGKSKAVKSKELIAAGAEMAKSLTNAVTHLLVDHLASTTSKTVKARKNGIAIVDETMVDQMMSSSTSSTSKAKKSTKAKAKAAAPPAKTKGKTNTKAKVKAKPKAATKAKVKKTATAASAAAATKQKNDGGAINLGHMASPSNDSSIIDPGCTFANGATPAVYQEYHCKLAKVDKTKNEDKYYFMQLVEVDSWYFLYKRYGRTGQGGMAEMVNKKLFSFFSFFFFFFFIQPVYKTDLLYLSSSFSSSFR